MLLRRVGPLLAIGLALLALPGRTSADQGVTISESEFKLSPSDIDASAGQVVHFTITNTGTIEHNFTVELEDAHVEQTLFPTNLKPGETRTADFTFSRPGKWEMYCPLDRHADLGMKGDIDVKAAVAAPSAPAAPAQAGQGRQFEVTGTVIGQAGTILTLRTSDLTGSEQPMRVDVSGLPAFGARVGDPLSLTVRRGSSDTFLALGVVSEGNFVSGADFNGREFGARKGSIEARVGDGPVDDEALAQKKHGGKSED